MQAAELNNKSTVAAANAEEKRRLELKLKPPFSGLSYKKIAKNLKR